MSNPSTLGRVDGSNSPYSLFACIDACVNSGIQTLGLDSDRAYSFAHDALDHNGNTDTSVILLSVSGIGTLQNTGNNQASIDKVRLLNSRPITIGPGASTVWFKFVNGSPQFTVIFSEKFLGRF